MSHSVTRLLGLGLTPGKLRGLQRISNPNGTLTMVATDQNSSMISMMKDSCKKRQGREPTYDEIVEAKVMLSRALSPALLAACSSTATTGTGAPSPAYAVPASTGLLVRVEKSGGDEEQGRRPAAARSSRAGASPRSSAAGPTRSSCSPSSSRPSPTRAEQNFEFTRADLRRVHEARHPLPAGDRSTSRSTARRRRRAKSYVDRKATTVIELGPLPEPLLRRLQGRVPRHARRSRPTRKLMDNLKKLNDACVKPWVLLGAGVDYPQVQEAGRDGDEGRGQRRARRPGVLEGVLHLHDAGGAAEVRRDRVRRPGARRSTRS